MRVELTCANALRPTHGLVASGPVDPVVADPPNGDVVRTRHRTSRKRAEAVGVIQALGFDALTSAVRCRAAEALTSVVRRWVVVFSDLEGAWCDDLERAGPEPVQVDLLAPAGRRGQPPTVEDV